MKKRIPPIAPHWMTPNPRPGAKLLGVFSKRRLLGLCLGVSCQMTVHAATPTSPPPYRLDGRDPAVKVTYYSSRILKLLDKLQPTPLKDPDSYYIRAIKTPGHSDTIGMIKRSEIHAPFARVEEAIERFDEYPKFWDDVLEAKVLSRDRNRTVVEFTRKAPAFFLSKIHYRMLYVSDQSKPGRAIYRQELIDGNRVSASDSLIVLDSLGPDLTEVTVLNFFEADFGPLRAIAEGTLWKRSLKNGLREDVAFRERLEHPDWDLKKITQEADELVDRVSFDKIEYSDQFKVD